MKQQQDKIVVNPLPIADISPDHTQARRVVPSGIPINVVTPHKTLGEWEASAQNEAPNFSLVEIIDSKGDEFDFDGKYAGSLLKVAQLAASIKRDGLTNPITVVREGNRYTIETGERRWWAFHLLEALYPGQYTHITAKVQQTLDVWKQASENTQREDLNAIAKARQFAILLMDLYRQSGEDNWLTYEEAVRNYGQERHYYAQVADGTKWRIPRGTGHRLLTALGEKSTNRLREIRSLLRLTDDIWAKADDENWTLSFALSHVPTQNSGVTVQNWTVTDDPDLTEAMEHEAKLHKKVSEAVQWLHNLKSMNNLQMLAYLPEERLRQDFDLLNDLHVLLQDMEPFVKQMLKHVEVMLETGKPYDA